MAAIRKLRRSAGAVVERQQWSGRSGSGLASEYLENPHPTSSQPARRRSAIAGLGQRLWVRFGLAAVIHVGVSPTKAAKSGAAPSQDSFEPEADELRDQCV